MKKVFTVLLIPFLLLSCQPGHTDKKVLVYTRNGEGFVHDNIQASVEMIKDFADENGFEYVISDQPDIFTEDQLVNFDAIIFSNTNNEAFENNDQRLAFKRYIQAGGGFIGIHIATGSERNWPWYWKMIGGKFFRHGAYQAFDVRVIDKNHPSTSFMPDVWEWEDEGYYFNHINPGIRVLLAHDMTTIEDPAKVDYPGEVFGELHPGAWCQEFDGGRQWYTSYGHKIKHYADPTFRLHVLGGILWTIDKPKPNFEFAKSHSIEM